jgi:membrane protease YdiL (CAAX protease family)
MFTKLSDVNKAVIFAILALALALVMIPVVTGSFITKIAYMWTPGIAALVMLLVVTRDGFSREGWKSLGLHRLGLSVWWIALLAALLIGVIATAIVWATPLASFVVPNGAVGEISDFLIGGIVLGTLVIAMGEELGWRGYLLPRLLPLGRTRALVLVGLIQAAWHMPLIFFTAAVYPPEANKLIVLPLFVATIMGESFFLGPLRLYTGSVWPASLGHATFNGLKVTLAAFTVTSSPIVVYDYLAGDAGILIVVGLAVVGIWLAYRFRSSPDTPQDDAPLDIGGGKEPTSSEAPAPG